jgi:hypothetical protein
MLRLVPSFVTLAPTRTPSGCRTTSSTATGEPMITLLSQTDFPALFRQFQDRAWMFETGEHYTWAYEAEELQRFQDGSPTPPPRVSWWRPWLDQIRELSGQGKQIGRVRVVTEPPTVYQRWEQWALPWHTEAGERIAYMSRSRAAAIGLPGYDFWLFDDEQLVLLLYDADGCQSGQILISREDAPALVAQHCAWRNLALHHATPAGEVVPA